MRYGVLGPLAAWDTSGRQVKIPEAKVRAILANLLVHQGGPISADRLIDDLWGDAPPGRPLNTLQTKISQLRRALGPDQVVRQPAGYQLNLDGDGLDAYSFQQLTELAARTGNPRSRVKVLTDALALWRGPAYADVADAAFAGAEITRLEELRLAALEHRAAARLELGEHSATIAELGELVKLNPLREQLRALHMLALYKAGRQGEALDSFHDLRTKLGEELGVDPGPALSGLHTSILRQEPSLVAEVPAVPYRTNLPSPATPLIGREKEVDSVRRALSAGQGGRLVTLTGPGGVGKTRLAISAARTLTEEFPDGVWLVEFAGLDRHASAGDVAERIITTLGLCDTAAESDPVDLVNWLCVAIADKRLLILLDNCEHVVEPVSVVATELLAAAAVTHTLVTTQEALDVPGETVCPVAPLALPKLPTVPSVRIAEEIGRSSAVQLFVERAAAAVPGFAITPDNASFIASICRRLDGIPLALELVATRLRVLSPEQITEGLDDRFALPTGPGRGRPTRQQTLRAMIGWSWELLSDSERAVLRRLAVSADGSTLVGARTVCADRSVPERDVLDVLSRLVDRSLVVRDGERFRLLESVAAYCMEQLAESGELAEVRLKFVRFHVAQAETAERNLRGPDQGRFLELLDTETVNMRRALELAVRHGEAALALRLVNALAWYWLLRSRLTEARRSFRAALEVEGSAEGSREIAEAWLAGMEGKPARIRIEDLVLSSRLHWFVGASLYRVGRHQEGRALIEEALVAARSHSDWWGEAAALAERADHSFDGKDFLSARSDAERSAMLFAQLGDRWGHLRAGRSLARVAETDGNHAEVTGLLSECLRAAEGLGLWVEAVETLFRIGRAFYVHGDLAAAGRMYERALQVASERSYTRGEVEADTWLAKVALCGGDTGAAEFHLRRAVERGQSHGFAVGGEETFPGIGRKAYETSPPGKTLPGMPVQGRS
ncbi:BTAD domain-containing putative transcriptional regulator [Nocardiopsis ansamitocini]|uniref:SARP family transcriptional regulator n=1 Tax=Nocardiopsis ansamitocini TaxID=1670832 RepID=A0A9W6P7V0_9ACTN|nr:BTAD domain-containing putative transcriptional regulator [Nocardiopsis ansamitocini]GLU49109.1 SARP family transcriptional regulator [Nocardiopsis ansamitocini]